MGEEGQAIEGREILFALWRSLEELEKEREGSDLIDCALTLLALRAVLERTDPLAWKKLSHDRAVEQDSKIRSLKLAVLGAKTARKDKNNNDWASPDLVAHLVSAVSDPRIGETPQSTISFVAAYQFLLEKSSQYLQPDFLGPPPPAYVCNLIAELLRPCQGSAYDPCARSGELLLELDGHQQAVGLHGERLRLYGQENNPKRWQQAHEQALIRGTNIDLGKGPLDDLFGNYLNDGLGLGGWWFRRELHPGLKCDFAVCYPPSSFIDYGLEYVLLDSRWEFGPGIPDPADFAWLQLALHHLVPGGTAAVVLSADTLSSDEPELARVRRNMVGEGIVRCIISLPSAPQSNHASPTALWVCTQKGPESSVGSIDPFTQEVLLIDLDNGKLLNESATGKFGEDIVLPQRVADLYHRWVENSSINPKNEVAATSMSVSIAELLGSGGNLAPAHWLSQYSTR